MNLSFLSRFSRRFLVLTALFGTTVLTGTLAQSTDAQMIVSRYQNRFSQPAKRIPYSAAVDAPLLGNGSLAVAIGGGPEAQHYYFSRNDFWRLKSAFDESYPAVLGRLSLYFDELKDARFGIEQDLYTAVTYSNFRKENTAVRLKSWVAASKDWLVIEVKNTGTTTLNGRVVLSPPEAEQFQKETPQNPRFKDDISQGQSQGMQWIQRGFSQDADIPTRAAIACQIIGREDATLSLTPGQIARIVVSSTSNFKSADPLAFVRSTLKQTTPAGIQAAAEAHLHWWKQYWNKSFVSIGDSTIEHQYYRSLYTMASCSRDPKFPPGIFGSWITKELPSWNGDYHLNYNYSAPFYGLYSSNRLEQATPYLAPLLDFMKRGAYYSEKITGIKDGILYPVGIGPLGMETTRKNELLEKYHAGYIKDGQVEDDGLFFGQKSNAAYGAVNISMQFYRTYDPAFTRRVYPYIKAVARFWDQYVKKEGNRYIIENDAIHEGTIGTLNPILSLGLVPMVMQTAIDMSELLKTDVSDRKHWKGKMDSLATYVFQERNGKTVFRYSEKGTAWWGDNTLGIQHIYPAGRLGPDSDPQLLLIARNTLADMRRWQDFNGSNSFFPAAVRVGYQADTILTQLRKYSLHTYPNGFQLNNPHGIENCSTVPNTVNEMLCMSHEQVLRLFPVWPRGKDASFANIRCEGAFLVSSSLKNGRVEQVRISSEQGRTCLLENPWPSGHILVRRGNGPATRHSGARISLPTKKGETLILTPVY